ncbi:MAG: 2OG-Fe(II) oxygenase family protein [Chloroflexota bacterium]
MIHPSAQDGYTIPPHGIELLKRDGYLITSIPAFSVAELQESFNRFIQADPLYKERYLQQYFGYGFDGYSYQGQTDSSNQAADDLVSTFVFSNFYEVIRYPVEFQNFLTESWQQIRPLIQSLEISLLEELKLSGLLDFYQQHMGHMVSCNYYPPIENFATAAADNTRLSAHPDVSLFTVFPFGMDGELEAELKDRAGCTIWQSIPASRQVVLFPGYLMELWSDGAIKALNHRVKLAQDVTAERFSFAFFSLPFPERRFVLPNRGPASASGSISDSRFTTSEGYFEAYLNLF